MDPFSRSLGRVLPEAQARNQKSSPRHLSRVNGWSLPLHPFQAVAWTTFLLLSVVTFGIVIPLLPGSWKCIAHSVTGAVFLFHVIVHLGAVTIDPAEASVRLRRYPKPVPTFDRSQHSHVIQNLYCHLCEVTVSEKAKHCGTCNKCVSGFDHHCKWLNNCVGSRNYWFFFCSMASALTGLLCVKVILLYVCIQYFIDPHKLRTDPSYKDVSAVTIWLLFLPRAHVPVKTPVFLCMMGGVLLVGMLSFVLLGHLFTFHIYLWLKNKSTFDYVKHARLQRGPEPRGRAQLVLQVGAALQQEKDGVLDSSPQKKGWPPPSPGSGEPAGLGHLSADRLPSLPPKSALQNDSSEGSYFK